jgi:hypothetical protein
VSYSREAASEDGSDAAKELPNAKLVSDAVAKRPCNCNGVTYGIRTRVANVESWEIKKARIATVYF